MLQAEEVHLVAAQLPLPCVLDQLVATMCSSAELAARGRPTALFSSPHRVLLARVLNAARQSVSQAQKTAVLVGLAPVLIPQV
jgi:hypothetical protein